MFRHYHACGQGCPGARCRDRVWRDPSAVRPKPGAEVTQEALVAFCRGQLACLKIPRYTVMLEAFPMTSSGKVQKCKLRDIAVAQVGAAEAGTTAADARPS